METWGNKYISQAGRAQLIRSIIYGLQGHWSDCLFLPKNILKKIQSIMAKFLWKGTQQGPCFYKVAWKHCCLKKTEGGLGFKELLGWNQCVLQWQIWRIIRQEEHSLWLIWISKYLLRRRAFWTMQVPDKCSWGLRKILNARASVLQRVTYRVGRNSCFLLWHDPWCLRSPLLNRYGARAISSLESQNMAPLNTIIRDGSWYLGVSNDLIIIEIRQHCNSTTIYASDEILWDGQIVHSLKVKDIWESSRIPGTMPPWFSFVWCKFRIPKVAFTVWLIVQERLLTKDRMQHFHMAVNRTCVLCGLADESHAHLFCSCTFTRSIYASWHWPISAVWNDFSLGNIIVSPGLRSIEQDMSNLFVSVVLYSVWRERNSRIHSLSSRDAASLIDEVKSTVRSKLSTCKFFIASTRLDPSLITVLY